MTEDMAGSGSTMADYMDVIVPLLIAEVAAVTLACALYFLVVHNGFVRNDGIAERIFIAFRRVRKIAAAGFAVAFAMFYASFSISGLTSIALRDSSIALFLLVGWGSLARGVWIYYFLSPCGKRRQGKATERQNRKRIF